jgi:hypothetical protein
VSHTTIGRLALQANWEQGQRLAAERGMEYLSRLPSAVPEGKFLVHNSVQPTRRRGSRGSRGWLQADGARLERCDCGWAAELGPHYRVQRPTRASFMQPDG